MIEETRIRLIDLFIFLGIFQSLFLSWFFIKFAKRENKANLFQGLLLLSLADVRRADQYHRLHR